MYVYKECDPRGRSTGHGSGRERERDLIYYIKDQSWVHRRTAPAAAGLCLLTWLYKTQRYRTGCRRDLAHTAMHSFLSSWPPPGRRRKHVHSHAHSGLQRLKGFTQQPPCLAAFSRRLLTQSPSSMHPPRRQAPSTPPTMGPTMEAPSAMIVCRAAAFMKGNPVGGTLSRLRSKKTSRSVCQAGTR
jgi:hypothetical protein